MPDPADTDPAAPRFSGSGSSRSFGRYLLLGTIARGGMGEIHLALAGSIAHAQKLCVVKTIRAEFTGEDNLVARFLDEGRVLCALQHPNIGQVMEVAIEQGVPFLAMEYVGGTDLAELIDAGRGSRRYPPLDVVLSCLAAVLDGMAYAHRAQGLDGTPFHLVHRDLSPENMRASWDGDVKVLDFGTALAVGRSAQTVHGGIFGKPGYMSPEQARREPLDPRTDLYAIGVVAWELLTLRDWMTLDIVDHLRALADGSHRPAAPSTMRPDVPASLDRWVACMTAFDPAQRFADATTARRALLDLAQAEGLRIDREVISEGLRAMLPGAQEAESERNRRWIAEARSQRGTTADPPRLRQQVNTEPLAPRDPRVLPGTPYRLGAQIGAGGMGEVYAAEHMDLGRPVALKVLSPALSSDPSLVQRFRLEARAIAALSHPNLVHVYDLGTTDDGRLFFAMERLRGESLRARLERAKTSEQGRLPSAECVRIGTAVARALAAAHAVGVVHRDIKPENIFLTEDGAVKVLDFGVAKTSNAAILGGTDANVTRAGELFGSPAYMAPEQARGREVDARTDLYSLGAVLFECATGSQLFQDASMVELLARHMAQEPDSPAAALPPRTSPRAWRPSSSAASPRTRPTASTPPPCWPTRSAAPSTPRLRWPMGSPTRSPCPPPRCCDRLPLRRAPAAGGPSSPSSPSPLSSPSPPRSALPDGVIPTPLLSRRSPRPPPSPRRLRPLLSSLHPLLRPLPSPLRPRLRPRWSRLLLPRWSSMRALLRRGAALTARSPSRSSPSPPGATRRPSPTPTTPWPRAAEAPSTPASSSARPATPWASAPRPSARCAWCSSETRATAAPVRRSRRWGRASPRERRSLPGPPRARVPRGGGALFRLGVRGAPAAVVAVAPRGLPHRHRAALHARLRHRPRHPRARPHGRPRPPTALRPRRPRRAAVPRRPRLHRRDRVARRGHPRRPRREPRPALGAPARRRPAAQRLRLGAASPLERTADSTRSVTFGTARPARASMDTRVPSVGASSRVAENTRSRIRAWVSTCTTTPWSMTAWAPARPASEAGSTTPGTITGTSIPSQRPSAL
ncbi:MAG: protein kinase [Deltaproteobacteria bacterium]|nr:protein kinase [Deltaproteobacteria bacterium]